MKTTRAPKEEIMRLFAALAITGSLAAYGASAQEIDASIDTDGDNMYSLEELQVLHADLTEDTFVTADTNADGFLDAEEYETALTDTINPPIGSESRETN
jgi:EF hand